MDVPAVQAGKEREAEQHDSGRINQKKEGDREELQFFSIVADEGKKTGTDRPKKDGDGKFIKIVFDAGIR